MRILYITHCSRDKDPELKTSGAVATPDRMYTLPSLQRFIRYCKAQGFAWAIFSDYYGVVFPHETIAWYNKPPSEVTEEEFTGLLESFITRLAGYDEIWFYQRAEDTHPLFQRIVELGRGAGLPIKEFPVENITD
jgi:hypothetical protein